MIAHFWHQQIVLIASVIVCVGCLWAIISDYIKDGIIGKVILFLIMIGSIGVFSRNFMHHSETNISELTVFVGMAIYWIRHMWLAYVFRRVQRWYFIKHPHRDRRKQCGCKKKRVNR